VEAIRKAIQSKPGQTKLRLECIRQTPVRTARQR
jgi:hypothetical protein